MKAFLNSPHLRVAVRAVFVAGVGVAVSGGDSRAVFVAAAQVALEYLTPANRYVGTFKK